MSVDPTLNTVVRWLQKDDALAAFVWNWRVSRFLEVEVHRFQAI